MQLILLWFNFINDPYMFRTFTCPSLGVLIYRLFHCRMWCYAIGVEAVVLRSWCVAWCTVCQLVSKLNHNKIICIKLVHLLYLYIWCTVTLISKGTGIERAGIIEAQRLRAVDSVAPCRYNRQNGVASNLTPFKEFRMRQNLVLLLCSLPSAAAPASPRWRFLSRFGVETHERGTASAFYGLRNRRN